MHFIRFIVKRSFASDSQSDKQKTTKTNEYERRENGRGSSYKKKNKTNKNLLIKIIEITYKHMNRQKQNQP